MESDELYELIDKYVNNELSAEESDTFRSQMESDKDLAEKVALYQALQQSLSAGEKSKTGEQRLKDNLSFIADTTMEADDSATKTVSLKRFYWIAAASVVLILGMIDYFQMTGSGVPSYAQYAVHEQLSLAERGAEDDLEIRAEKAFNEGDYSNAVGNLHQLLERNPENTEIQLYYAISLMETNQFEEAEEQLNPIVEGSSIYKNAALWYLGLMYLKQENYTSCSATLKRIPESSEYYAEARELLNKLD